MSLMLGMTAVVLHFAIGRLRRVLEQVRLNERALTDSNRELQHELAERMQAEQRLRQAKGELENQNSRLKTLYRVGQLVNSTLETDTILGYLTEEAMHITDATHGQVWVVVQTEQEGRFEQRSQRGFSPEEAQRAQTVSLTLDQGINGRAFRTQQTVRVDDVKTDPGYFPLTPGTRSELVMPIIHNGQVLGNLDLQSPELGTFRDADLDFLSALADQAAVALHNAQLYVETQRRLREQTALRKAGNVISSALEPETILNSLAQHMSESIDATSAYICTFEPGVTDYTVVAEYIGAGACVQEQVSDLGVTYQFGDAKFLGRMRAEQPDISHVDDPDLDETERTHLQKYRAQSVLCIPLHVSGELIGFAELWESRRRREFSPEEISLCQGIAQQAAVAIEKARLFKAEAQRRQEAETLRRAALTLTSVIDLDEVLERILTELQNVVPFDSATIQLLRDDELEVIAGRGLPNLSASVGVRFPARGDNPNTLLLDSRQPIIIDDAQMRYPIFRQEPHASANIHGWLGVPLLIGDDIIGMMTLDNHEPNFYTKVHARTATAFAAQAAIAIENARLFKQAQEELKERKRAEQALRESHQTFLTVLDGIATDIYVADMQTYEILFMNKHMQDNFGTDLVGMICYQVFRGESGPCLHCTNPKLLDADGNPTGVQVWETKNPITGKWYINYDRAITWYDSRLVRLQVATDITDRKEAEAALATYAAKLEGSNRELEEFAYIASHDLQEPLRKVKAFGDRLQARYSSALDERGLDYLVRMQDAATRMQALIDGLLTYSRVTTKARPFVPVDLSQVAREVISDLEVRIEQARGQVETEDLPTIKADPIQMRQLLQNLIVNALKFHREDEPPVVRIYAKVPVGEGASSNGLCQILVQDNGIGFDERHTDRIFQVFQRLHGRGHYEGTGIGLATCRKIVERHGGNITAKSSPGQGATFIVTLPLRQHQGAEI